MADPLYVGVAYTDGACKGNPGPGGWGYLFVEEGAVIASGKGGEPLTTNNQMELQAVIEALQYIEDQFRSDTHLTIHTDSQYVILGITQWINGWKARGWRTAQKEPVKNQDHWERLDALVGTYGHIDWIWVKGHAGDEHNEAADVLANQGIRYG